MTWDYMVPLPAKRIHHGLVAIDSSVFVVGGSTVTESNPKTQLSDSFAWQSGDAPYGDGALLRHTPSDDDWETLPPMQHARFAAGVASFENTLFVVGGKPLLTTYAPSSAPTPTPIPVPTALPTAAPTLPPGRCTEALCIATGGGWTLVRRVQAGNTWHPSTDRLAGTDEYGTWENSGTVDATFSVRFDSYSRDDYTQFMFATGDEELWLIATATAVDGATGEVMSSSSSSESYNAGAWYNRAGSSEDPWISLSDHGTAVSSGEIMYGGNNYGGSYASLVLPVHNGANVFIRTVSNKTTIAYAAHNSQVLTLTNTAGGCSYDNAHAFQWTNIGSMAFDECAIAASEYGLMMTPGAYSESSGWYGHRVGDTAMTGVWNSMQLTDTSSEISCVLGRDSRSAEYTVALPNPSTAQASNGLRWTYEDFGLKYFDECMLLASEAGAIIITPPTIDDDDNTGFYWVHSVHMCCTYEYVSAPWSSFSYYSLGSGARSSAQHNCLVGYVDNPESSPPSSSPRPSPVPTPAPSTTPPTPAPTSCVNLAAGASTGYNTEAGLHSVSGGSADGITDGQSYSDCGWGCCVHTSDCKTDPFVYVDLGATYTVDRVRLLSGPSYTLGVSVGAVIAMSNTPYTSAAQFDSGICNTLTGGLSAAYTWDDIDCTSNVSGRYVGYLVPSDCVAAIFCELEVCESAPTPAPTVSTVPIPAPTTVSPMPTPAPTVSPMPIPVPTVSPTLINLASGKLEMFDVATSKWSSGPSLPTPRWNLGVVATSYESGKGAGLQTERKLFAIGGKSGGKTPEGSLFNGTDSNAVEARFDSAICRHTIT